MEIQTMHNDIVEKEKLNERVGSLVMAIIEGYKEGQYGNEPVGGRSGKEWLFDYIIQKTDEIKDDFYK